MLKLAVKTKPSLEDVVKRTMGVFDSGGYGPEARELTGTCAYFVGGGGDVTACAEGKGASVQVESREWDFQTMEFISKLG